MADKKTANTNSSDDSPTRPEGNENQPSSSSSANRWTFLTNHAHVLVALHVQPESVLREVAVRVGITERAVQRIIQDLEEEGFIRREKIGRQNKYEVLNGESLRHPLEAHRTIGDLLQLIKNSSD